MTPETKKITPQKAAALAKREGLSIKDMAEGQEVVTTEGVLLKEAKTYYLTTEPKPAAVVSPGAEAAEAMIETTTTYLTKPEQTFVEPKREKQVKAPLSAKATKLAYSSSRVDLDAETPLHRAGTRRIKSRLLKRILRKKNAGRSLSFREIQLLGIHASGSYKAAQSNQGFGS